jgi:hypothetical protein
MRKGRIGTGIFDYVSGSIESVIGHRRARASEWHVSM